MDVQHLCAATNAENRKPCFQSLGEECILKAIAQILGILGVGVFVLPVSSRIDICTTGDQQPVEASDNPGSLPTRGNLRRQQDRNASSLRDRFHILGRKHGEFTVVDGHLTGSQICCETDDGGRHSSYCGGLIQCLLTPSRQAWWASVSQDLARKGHSGSAAFIEAQNLVKTYQAGKKTVIALDDLSLSVPKGSVQALLGPNGAGKTTTVKVLTTLTTPDSGQARINGIDVLEHPEQIRRMIGVSGQYAAVDENLTGFENLDMVGRLYHLSPAASRARARELIDMFDLVEAGDRVVKGFSGGMRRRIDLAGALVVNPPVLFLDEPTTGLDPRSRLALWDVIKKLVGEGTTVLLTTQYLEEADQLADNIAVIDEGKVIAQGTSDELKLLVGGQRVEITIQHLDDRSAAISVLERHVNGDITFAADERTLVGPVDNAAKTLQAVLKGLADAGVELNDAGMRRPTLDDVFLQLTGHAAEEVTA